MFPNETEQDKKQDKPTDQPYEPQHFAEQWDSMEIWVGQESATIAMPPAPKPDAE